MYNGQLVAVMPRSGRSGDARSLDAWRSRARPEGAGVSRRSVSWPPASRRSLTSLAAIVAALLLGGVFLALRGKDPIAAFALLFSRGLGHVVRHHRDAHTHGAAADRQRRTPHRAARRRLEHRRRRSAPGRRTLRRCRRDGRRRSGRQPRDVARRRTGRHGRRARLGARAGHSPRALGPERDHHHVDDELRRAQRDVVAGQGTGQRPGRRPPADAADPERDAAARHPRLRSPHRPARGPDRRRPGDDPLSLHRPRLHARRAGPEPAGRHPRRHAGQPADPAARCWPAARWLVWPERTTSSV